jgi:hypothetical protein
VDSSSFMSPYSSPSMTGGCPFTPHLRCLLWKSTIRSRGLGVKLTLIGILSYNKQKECNNAPLIYRFSTLLWNVSIKL